MEVLVVLESLVKRKAELRDALLDADADGSGWVRLPRSMNAGYNAQHGQRFSLTVSRARTPTGGYE